MKTSDYAIRIKGLGKQYRLGREQSSGMYRYKSLRDSVGSVARSPLKTLRNTFSQEPLGDTNSFWALKDVSFDVKRGEVVGIIGRNGAGKSTLLKILSRITRPTAGEIELRGRVGSLLEVGTGFHPELSGRENIYLNGAVLGMTRSEVKKNFDEIVAFSEIEKFLDTPVKQYSSGMYTRLAFAVAAHLDPEILIVDEVLAVGDQAFQQKCLGKMQDVAKHGRTILFVSHNMSAVQQLCHTGVVLSAGTADVPSDIHHAIERYLAAPGGFDRSPRQNGGTGYVRLTECNIRDAQHHGRDHFCIGEDIVLSMSLRCFTEGRPIRMGVRLESIDGVRIANMVDVDSAFSIQLCRETEHVDLVMRDVRLYPSTYSLSVWIGDSTSTIAYDSQENVAQFTVVDGGRKTMRTLSRADGMLFLTPDWIRH